ncbi:MAG TPA: PAS domain S-box protein [Anaeromyxobacter sp.]|nr:PAS domain S-box protein [Anaeromyxobacter sp.]
MDRGWTPEVESGGSVRRSAGLLAYAFALLATGAAFGLRVALAALLGPPYLLFYPAVMLVALLFGFGPGLLATATSAVLSAWSLLPSRPDPWRMSGRDALGLAVFVAMGVLVSAVAARYRLARRTISGLERERALDEAERLARAREAEAVNRYQLLAANTREVILFVRPRDGRVLEANAAATAAYGYTAEELRGLTVHQLRAPETRDAASEQLGEADRVGLRFETIHRRKDGTTFPVEVSSQGATIGGTRLVLSVIRDISDRRRAETALRESEERLRLFVEHAPAAVAMFDRDMRYLAVSRRYLDDYRLKQRSLVGRSHYDVFPEIPERWREIHRRCLAGAVERCEEDPFPRADGTTDWVRWEIRPWHDARGRIGGIILFSEIVTDRKLAVERLAGERERLAVTLRSIGDAVIATDADARVTLLNPVAERLVGWAAEEAVGRPLEEIFRIVDEDSGAPAQSPVERVLREGIAVGLANHAALVARDRTSRPIADSGAPIRGADGALTGVVLVFRDQTEERRAERALRESEARYRGIFEQAAVAVALVESRTGRFLQANARLCELLGYGREELLARTWQEVTHPDDVGVDRAGVARMQASGEPYRREKRYLRKDGTVVWASLNVSPVRLLGEESGMQVAVLVDLSDRKQAEEALSRSEGRFQALIEKASDIIVVLDAEMRITFWSPSATEQLGFTPEDVLGRKGSELVHPDDREEAREIFRALVSTPGATARFVRRQLHKDGSFRLVEVIGRNLLHDPVVRGIVANLRDVTEQRRLTEQVQQAQKLESIGRLAGGVAHDFNNLLTVILSCADSLREGLGQRDAQRLEDVDQIRAAGERARDLTRQLLAFARKQVIAPVPLDLNAVVEGSEKMLGRLLGEDVALAVRAAPDLWLARCDLGQMEQVLVNLAVNARDAMPRGGTLVLETGNVRVGEDRLPADRDVPPGEYVRLAVEDSGLGMSEEVKSHLFEPFFTTKPTGQGTGLGLATVYGIVTQSGGRIRVESAPGQGTRFEILLPRTLEAGVAPAPRASPAPVAPGGTEAVLVVEDDPQVREVTVRALEAGGYRVVVADHAHQALELPPGDLSRLRLLVTDVVMPGLDGHALAAELRRQHPGLRVLYVSGYTRDVVAQRGVRDSGVGFLAKPFTGAALLEKVRAILDQG